jgi:hypothetical protein
MEVNFGAGQEQLGGLKRTKSQKEGGLVTLYTAKAPKTRGYALYCTS